MDTGAVVLRPPSKRHLPSELKDLARERAPSEWRTLPKDQIPIPEHLVKERAYLKYAARGKDKHGFDKADYYESLAEWRHEVVSYAMEPVGGGNGSSDYIGEQRRREGNGDYEPTLLRRGGVEGGHYGAANPDALVEADETVASKNSNHNRQRPATDPDASIPVVQVNDAGVFGVIPEGVEHDDEWEDDEDADAPLFVDDAEDKWRAIGAGGKVLATAQEPDDLEEAVRCACGGELPPYTVERVFSRSEVPFLSGKGKR